MSVSAPTVGVHDNGADTRQAGMADVRELWEYRDVVRAFASKTIRIRYKESFLGIVWVLLQPLALLIPFVVVLGRIASISGGGVPYAAFAAAVVSPWQLVATGLATGSASLVTEGPLIRKVYFPRSAPVAAAVVAATFDAVIAVVVSIPLVLVLGGDFSGWILLLPLMLLPLLVLTFSFALVLAGLYVQYRDVRFVLPLVTQLLLYGSPVAFPVTVVSPSYRSLYAVANPFVGPLEGVRRTLALGQAPDWKLFGLSLITTAVIAVLAILAFGRLQRDLADLV